ncbi:SDR family oxidoreductase [Actinokineospora auranticolor]|uniref:NAD(P)-dependent dehydrogenase (Short-subunit alcohol dehydrogenase family) n=1 Tax=Actinokineospora auranticolor TaxID=155976 RepID=A0A2S6GJN5_9PSEU|nr:SDR family oxidoreductase [Actinokineospora auranticolor]PPK65429.1 NAD(P)-dependent dehydrogenase (short-subunit alcohol dehydrogenase family) [Actinokineospora auranticolor]
MTLGGATVLVIGGSSGMGLGVARAAATRGATVVVTTRGGDPAAVADRVARALPDPGRVRALPCDLTDAASVAALFERVRAVDHLVITATPGSSGGAFADTDVEAARGVVDGKLWGTWRAARHAVAAGAKSLLFTTGGMAVRPAPGRAAVSVAFAAVEALGRALAVELAPVRVNVVRPGLTDTEMWASVPEADRAEIFRGFAETAPARRVGTPTDIGEAAVYLMTAGFVTGAVLDVDGGSLLV